MRSFLKIPSIWMTTVQFQDKFEKLKWQEAKSILTCRCTSSLWTFFKWPRQRVRGNLGCGIPLLQAHDLGQHMEVYLLSLEAWETAQSNIIVPLHFTKIRFGQMERSPFGLKMEYTSVNMRMCFPGKQPSFRNSQVASRNSDLNAGLTQVKLTI